MTPRHLLVLLVLIAPTVMAASSSRLGSSDAQRCFEESRMPFSSSGLRYCDDALRDSDLTRRDRAATHSNRGIILGKNGRYQEALDDHNRAIELIPDLGQAYINRGNTLYHMRDYPSALADYQTAIELGASPPHVPHYNRGIVLARMGRKPEAIEALRQALALNPDSDKIADRIAELENDE